MMAREAGEHQDSMFPRPDLMAPTQVLQRRLARLLVVLCGTLLAGCEMLMFLPFLVGEVYTSIEAVKERWGPGVTAEQLYPVRNVLLLCTTSLPDMNQSASLSQSGGSDDSFCNRLSAQLSRSRFKVTAWETVEHPAREPMSQAGTETEERNAISAAKTLGMDALMIITATGANSVTEGFMGIGRTPMVSISTARVRVVSAENGSPLLTLEVGFKKAQSVSAAAKALGLYLTDKLSPPVEYSVP